jgi:hypothetical protein
MVGNSSGTFEKGETAMRQLSITPSITVTIGRHTRIYFAFVTTAPAELDSPATVTLHASTFSDVVGFAADPVTHDELRGRAPGRLVLVDAMELRRRSPGGHRAPDPCSFPIPVRQRTRRSAYHAMFVDVCGRKLERGLCQNRVTRPPKPHSNSVIYGDAPRHIVVAEVVDGNCVAALRYALVRAARVDFQACSFNHSDISPHL